MPYRIGIDVGGTFTHAVAVDAATMSVAQQVRVPTTHRAQEGVALGVTQALQSLLDAGIRPDDVTFIAHSTTQATNALLEGDVSPVGIIGMGRGADALKARKDTAIGRIELAPGRFLETYHAFLEANAVHSANINIQHTVSSLQRQGAQVIVAAEAFGVDDPANERLILDVCAEMGVPATASHEMSGLYGLRTRTRTAVVNASILPKMMQTAQMTAQAVAAAGISAPLMIMRSDGGVMSIDEMRRRPILTVLSGPAAGVAAALMYARISDGIFIEVGGTSSDITCIRNGQASVHSATIGGHKLFLRTLDVRTIGLAGGSMVRVQGQQIAGVGPRSAHMAGLEYSCFVVSSPSAYQLKSIQPRPNDPADYIIAENAAGKQLALTLSCAANVAGAVPDGDYAQGDGMLAGAMLMKALGVSARDAAEAILTSGGAQAVGTIETLLQDYQLPREHVTLIGGGGGAGAVVPHTGAMMALPWRIAENAPVISAIGVALALVRDTVERTIPMPTKEDLLRIRQEAIAAVVRVGANPETVEVQVEVDSQHQIVRATATGATEMRARDLAETRASDETLRQTAAKSLDVAAAVVQEAARTPFFIALCAIRAQKKFFGLLQSKRRPLRLLDHTGVIRLQLAHGAADAAAAGQAPARLRAMIAAQTQYGDGGERLPAVFLAAGARIFNLSGLLTAEQIISLAEAELQHLPDDDAVLLLVGEQ